MPYILDHEFKIKHVFQGIDKLVISILRSSKDIPNQIRRPITISNDVIWDTVVCKPTIIQRLFKTTFNELIEKAVIRTEKKMYELQKESEFSAKEYRDSVSFSTKLIENRIKGCEIDNSDIILDQVTKRPESEVK